MKGLYEVKQILKIGTYNINGFIEKHVKYTQNVNESENNIAYLNETCKNLSAAIRKKLSKVDDYEIGDCLSYRY